MVTTDSAPPAHPEGPASVSDAADAPGAPGAPGASGASGPGKPGKEAGAKPPIQADFMQFLSGLAMQTLIHLGKIPMPGGDKRTVDLPNAKYSIDLLGILEEKTKGNLTADESRYLTAILHDLRLEYIQGAKPA